MPGTIGSLHHFRHLSEGQVGRFLPLCIHLLGGGGKGEVYPERLQRPQILLHIVRIGGEVGGVIELGRIEEDTHHRAAALPDAAAYEAEVSLVQSAHRRDETDRLSLMLLPYLAESFSQSLLTIDYFHGYHSVCCRKGNERLAKNTI